MTTIIKLAYRIIAIKSIKLFKPGLLVSITVRLIIRSQEGCFSTLFQPMTFSFKQALISFRAALLVLPPFLFLILLLSSA